MEKPAFLFAATLLLATTLPAQQAAEPGMQQTAQPQSTQLTLPHFLSDGMVLQRNAPIHLWGSAAPGDVVSATLNTGQAQTTTTSLGQWSIYLPPQPAGGPYTLTVSSPTSKQTRQDVMLGDLWLASGQSNMEMPLSGWGPKLPIQNSAQEIASANLPNLRLLLVPRASAEHPLQDIAATWQRSTPETAAKILRRRLLLRQGTARRPARRHRHHRFDLGRHARQKPGSPQRVSPTPPSPAVWSAYADFLNADAQLQPTLAAEKREDEAAVAAGKTKARTPVAPGRLPPFAPPASTTA